MSSLRLQLHAHAFTLLLFAACSGDESGDDRDSDGMSSSAQPVGRGATQKLEVTRTISWV